MKNAWEQRWQATGIKQLDDAMYEVARVRGMLFANVCAHGTPIKGVTVELDKAIKALDRAGFAVEGLAYAIRSKQENWRGAWTAYLSKGDTHGTQLPPKEISQ